MVCEQMLKDLAKKGAPMENGVFYFDSFDRLYVQASLSKLSGSDNANRAVLAKLLPKRYRITLNDLCKVFNLTHLNGIEVSKLRQSIKIGYLICGAGIDWLAKHYRPKKSPFGDAIRVWREKCPAKRSVEPPQEILDFLAQKGSDSASDSVAASDSEATACETDSDADMASKPRKKVVRKTKRATAPATVPATVPAPESAPVPTDLDLRLRLYEIQCKMMGMGMSAHEYPQVLAPIDPDTQIRLYEARCKMLEMEMRNLEFKSRLGLTSST